MGNNFLTYILLETVQKHQQHVEPLLIHCLHGPLVWKARNSVLLIGLVADSERA